jgi:hypothetical protein
MGDLALLDEGMDSAKSQGFLFVSTYLEPYILRGST